MRIFLQCLFAILRSNLPKNWLCLILLLIASAGAAQKGRALKNNMPVKLTYSVAADSGYTFSQVLTGVKGRFMGNDSINPNRNRFYWVQIVIANPQHIAGEYAMDVQPHLLNTYYYFDANQQKWLQQTVGILTGATNERTKNIAMHLPLQPYALNVVYVKMDVGRLAQLGLSIKPALFIEHQHTADAVDEVIWDGWLVSVAVMSFFFISNLFVYKSFRDRPIVFYLVLQVSAIIYLTTYRKYMSLGLFNLWASSNGTVRYYNLNTLLMHIGIVLGMYGFIQLCRSYLNTKKYLPRADVLLKYGMYAYMLFSAVLMVINVCFYYLERFTLLYDNIFLLVLFVLTIYTCVAGYQLKLRASGVFLLALVLPSAFMTCVPLFYIFINVNGDLDLWLPNLAEVSDAVLFSAALVTRIRIIQGDLKTAELQAQKFAFDLREAELQRSLVELENKQINNEIKHEKHKYGVLNEELQANQRELASTALYMVQKNELLLKLKTEIDDLNKLKTADQQKQFAGIESILKDSERFDEDWAKFKLHFEQVHPHFFETLQTNHPSLTKNEIRLYAYFHINLSAKEIALLLNIAPTSVRQAKMRLLKKMGLPATTAHKNEDEE